MTSFGRLFMVALIAGSISGIFVSVVHEIATTPIILAAEVYENSAAADTSHTAAADTTTSGTAAAMVEDGTHEGEPWSPSDGIDRTLYTTAGDVLTGIGFALLLVPALRFWGGRIDWRTGLCWGLAGFAAVVLAPGLGLPPEVPGTVAAPLFPRQVWWIATVLSTGGGLAMILLGRKAMWCVLGIALIVAPHAIGAPQPAEYGSLAPEAIAHRFVIAATVTGLLFWAALGTLSGFFYSRILQPGT
jgi:cobalt transporter subunit CbtA